MIIASVTVAVGDAAAIVFIVFIVFSAFITATPVIAVDIPAAAGASYAHSVLNMIIASVTVAVGDAAAIVFIVFIVFSAFITATPVIVVDIPAAAGASYARSVLNMIIAAGVVVVFLVIVLILLLVVVLLVLVIAVFVFIVTAVFLSPVMRTTVKASLPSIDALVAIVISVTVAAAGSSTFTIIFTSRTLLPAALSSYLYHPARLLGRLYKQLSQSLESELSAPGKISERISTCRHSRRNHYQDAIQNAADFEIAIRRCQLQCVEQRRSKPGTSPDSVSSNKDVQEEIPGHWKQAQTLILHARTYEIVPQPRLPFPLGYCLCIRPSSRQTPADAHGMCFQSIIDTGAVEKPAQDARVSGLVAQRCKACGCRCRRRGRIEKACIASFGRHDSKDRFDEGPAKEVWIDPVDLRKPCTVCACPWRKRGSSHHRRTESALIHWRVSCGHFRAKDASRKDTKILRY
jgi:hypothetical protein